MELLPFPDHSKNPTLSKGSYKSPQLPHFSGARRVSLYPSVIDEPILEEDDEEDTEIPEGTYCIADIFRGRKFSLRLVLVNCMNNSPILFCQN